MADTLEHLGFTPAHSGDVDLASLGFVPTSNQDESTDDDTTALGAAGRGAAGMIPLGTQAYAGAAGMSENKPYIQERRELEKEIEADKENHPIARVGGQAAGLVAPALLTGGASAPESLAGAAGQGALVGGGFGVGNAIDTLAGGGSGEKAAGDVALGAGLGALGGVAGQKLAGTLNKAVPSIENYAARKSASAVGLGSDELGNMPEQEVTNLGKMLMEKGIVKKGASTQEMFDSAKALQENYGQKIGQIGNQATELGLTADTKPLLDTLGKKYNAANELANPDERKAALFYKRGMADIIAMANRNGAERVAADITTEQPSSFITFQQLQDLKKSYGNSAFENGAVKNAAAADVYSQLGNGQKAIIDKASTNPNLPADLKDAMSGYSRMHPVVEGMQDVLGRERAGNMPAKGFGMMGKMVGQLPGQQNPVINMLTALGLVGAGHPMWGIGAATASLQNPRTMANAAQSLAGAIPSLAEKLPLAASEVAGSATASAPKVMSHQNMGETVVHHAIGHAPLLAQEAMAEKPSATTLNLNHPAMAKWKPTFDKSAAKAQNPSEVEKSHAVTDFVLSQRDPAYAAAKQKAADEPAAQDSGVPNMAAGGIVPDMNNETDTDRNLRHSVGSNLQGFSDQLKNPTHETKPPPEPLPNKPTVQMHQPFNSDFADKLKAFLDSRKENDDAESR